VLQGPHHGAQKSTSTGRIFDSSITSFMKVLVVVSETRSPASAGAGLAAPSLSSISGSSRGIGAIDGSFRGRLQIGSGRGPFVRRRPGNVQNLRLMAGFAQEAEEVGRLDTGGSGVHERMEIQ